MWILPNWICNIKNNRNISIKLPFGIFELSFGEWNGITWFFTIMVFGFGYNHRWTKKEKDMRSSDKYPFG